MDDHITEERIREIVREELVLQSKQEKQNLLKTLNSELNMQHIIKGIKK